MQYRYKMLLLCLKVVKYQTMEELLKENAELKKKIEALKLENRKLRRARDSYEKEARHATILATTLREQYPYLVEEVEPKPILRDVIVLDTLEYNDFVRPTLSINYRDIQFEKSTDRAAEAARVVFTPNHLKKLKKDFIPAAEIYEWFKYSEPWENISVKERKKFQKDLYQWLYRLDQKISPMFHNMQTFHMKNNEYKLSLHLKLVEHSK